MEGVAADSGPEWLQQSLYSCTEKQTPCLWNSKIKEYRDKNKRDIALNNIQIKLKEKKYDYSIKQIKKKQQSGLKSCTGWNYFPHQSILFYYFSINITM